MLYKNEEYPLAPDPIRVQSCVFGVYSEPIEIVYIFFYLSHHPINDESLNRRQTVNENIYFYWNWSGVFINIYRYSLMEQLYNWKPERNLKLNRLTKPTTFFFSIINVTLFFLLKAIICFDRIMIFLNPWECLLFWTFQSLIIWFRTLRNLGWDSNRTEWEGIQSSILVNYAEPKT